MQSTDSVEEVPQREDNQPVANGDAASPSPPRWGVRRGSGLWALGFATLVSAKRLDLWLERQVSLGLVGDTGVGEAPSPVPRSTPVVLEHRIYGNAGGTGRRGRALVCSSKHRSANAMPSPLRWRGFDGTALITRLRWHGCDRTAADNRSVSLGGQVLAPLQGFRLGPDSRLPLLTSDYPMG
jgi:hypothetical protein